MKGNKQQVNLGLQSNIKLRGLWSAIDFDPSFLTWDMKSIIPKQSACHDYKIQYVKHIPKQQIM
jgi:hypothetical protein